MSSASSLRALVERQRGKLLFRAGRDALPLCPEELDDAVRAALLADGVEQRRERRVVRPREERLAGLRQRIGESRSAHAPNLPSAAYETLRLELLEVAPQRVRREAEFGCQARWQ